MIAIVQRYYNELIDEASKYFAPSEILLIKKAYKFAEDLHKGQLRKSGEPYIIHPIAVACILMEEIHNCDLNSVLAALLHDTIEDTGITTEFIVKHFNEDVAHLVLGVTNFSNTKFGSKSDEDEYYNTMVLRGLANDYRIGDIKVSDRLHNMRTLEYTDAEKRVYKALETEGFFVPYAYKRGANKAARELENLCFKYTNPLEYQKVVDIITDFTKSFSVHLKKLYERIGCLFSNQKIAHRISFYYMDFWNLFNNLNEQRKLSKIRNFLNYKIVVDSRQDCYDVLNLIKKEFGASDSAVHNHLDIVSPEGTRGIYIEIHGFKQYFVRVEICTKKMDMVNKYGFSCLVQDFNAKNIYEIQKILYGSSDFMANLKEMTAYYTDNKELMDYVRKELFQRSITVYTPEGRKITLPIGSTVLDFAYKVHTDIGNQAACAYIKDVLVDLNFPLKDGDIIRVVKAHNILRTKEDLNYIVTTRARKKINAVLNS